MKEIKAIVKTIMVENVLDALMGIPDLPGVTVDEVEGFGRQRGGGDQDEGQYAFVQKSRLEIVVPDRLVDQLVRVICEAAHTGQAGDGKIFVMDVLRAVRIRNGDEGDSAL
jgi:nitrogen regulatory protein PII